MEMDEYRLWVRKLTQQVDEIDRLKEEAESLGDEFDGMLKLLKEHRPPRHLVRVK